MNGAVYRPPLRNHDLTAPLKFVSVSLALRIMYQYVVNNMTPPSTTSRRRHTGGDNGAMSLLAMMPRKPAMGDLTLPRPSIETCAYTHGSTLNVPN
jgi:hypothetical protein